jgi:hypothetical protein
VAGAGPKFAKTMSIASDIEDLEMPSGFRESLSELERVSLNQIWEDVRKEAAIGLEDAGWLKHVENIAKEALRQGEKASEDEFAKLLHDKEMRSACQTVSIDLKKKLLEHIASIVKPEVDEMEG